jgi:hypothetical protein
MDNLTTPDFERFLQCLIDITGQLPSEFESDIQAALSDAGIAWSVSVDETGTVKVRAV